MNMVRAEAMFHCDGCGDEVLHTVREDGGPVEGHPTVCWIHGGRKFCWRCDAQVAGADD